MPDVSISALVLFQVAALFARSMLDLHLQRNGLEATVAKDLSYLVVPPLLLTLMFPYLKRCRGELARLLAPARLTARVIARSMALGLTLRLLWWASTTFLIGVGAFRDDGAATIVGPVTGFACPPYPVLALSVLVMGCLTPITEEIACRGFVLHRLLSNGALPAVVISSALFAVMHEPRTYAVAFLVGVVLACQALSYRSLWGPIVTHGTYNAAAVIDWECFRLVWNPPLSDPRLRLLTWLSVLAMVGGAALIVRLLRDPAAGAREVPRPH